MFPNFGSRKMLTDVWKNCHLRLSMKKPVSAWITWMFCLKYQELCICIYKYATSHVRVITLLYCFIRKSLCKKALVVFSKRPIQGTFNLNQCFSTGGSRSTYGSQALTLGSPKPVLQCYECKKWVAKLCNTGKPRYSR